MPNDATLMQGKKNRVASATPTLTRGRGNDASDARQNPPYRAREEIIENVFNIIIPRNRYSSFALHHLHHPRAARAQGCIIGLHQGCIRVASFEADISGKINIDYLHHLK